MTAAIVVEDLHVAYGTTWALDGVDLQVAGGSTLGVLGHNGAGKTTLIRVLTTLVRPNAGRVTIELILDPADGAGLSWLHRHTEVISRGMGPDGRLAVVVRADPANADRVRAKFGLAVAAPH